MTSGGYPGGMYRPAHYRSDDPAQARAVIQAHPFGTLITTVDGRPFATHIPFIIDGDHLYGHLARANPQRESLGGEVLVSFLGPHAYVSPRWYRNPSQDVPTWNYVAVHVYGVAEVVDPEPTVRALARQFDPTWVPGPTVTGLLPGIVAFRLPLTEVELKLKLSQNKAEPDAERVRAAFDGGGEMERELAAWMQRARGNR